MCDPNLVARPKIFGASWDWLVGALVWVARLGRRGSGSLGPRARQVWLQSPHRYEAQIGVVVVCTAAANLSHAAREPAESVTSYVATCCPCCWSVISIASHRNENDCSNALELGGQLHCRRGHRQQYSGTRISGFVLRRMDNWQNPVFD